MKIINFLLCSTAAAGILSSCIYVGDLGGKQVRCKGPVVEKTFDLTGFESIRIDGSCDLVLSQQDNFLVKVNANEQVYEYLDYAVEDKTLVIKTKNNVTIHAETYGLTVALPLLKGFTINGAGDIDLKGGYYAGEGLTLTVNGAGDLELNDIQVPSIAVTLNGAGDIDLKDIDVQEITVSVNGAGDLFVSGKADKASFSISGAGDIDARGLDVEDVDTHKSGIASIKLKNR